MIQRRCRTFRPIRIAALGLAPQQIEILKRYGLLAVDTVTGFQEARSGHARFETLKLAILHVLQTQDRAFYVEMDLKNLGGLNARLGHTRTNEIIAKIAGLIQVFLTAAGQDPVFFRHGGDEMSAMIFDTTEARLQVAKTKLHRAVQELAEQYHLKDPRKPEAPRRPSVLRDWRSLRVHRNTTSTCDESQTGIRVGGHADGRE